MKKIRQAKAQDNSQTPYTKILTSLRSAVSKDYSKVIPKETRAFVLGYDWDSYLADRIKMEAMPAAVVFCTEVVLIQAVN